MSSRPRAPDESARLKASPNYVLALSMDGRAYVAKDSEPYTQFWLDERERCLHHLFSRRGGETVAHAMAESLRLRGLDESARERRALLAAIAQMREAGLLQDAEQDTSRYDAAIVEAYLKYRPFPPEIAADIAAEAGIGRETRVLDIAGGPGDLALQLAERSDRVTLLDLSRGFLASARARAKRAGRPLNTLHESANRLLHSDETYDVVTVAQALHWLDDVAICRSMRRMLSAQGSFFVVAAEFDTPPTHPLAYVFGRDSVLGATPRRPFAEAMRNLARRLSLMFEALDAPAERIDPLRAGAAGGDIRLAAARLYEQPRPLGLGFASGFLSPAHVAPLGRTLDDFMVEMAERARGASEDALTATFSWGLLRFARGGAGEIDLETPRALPYAGPPEASLSATPALSTRKTRPKASRNSSSR
jgi:2-polyprenyl-3-methyl-5-hydroxy-6-metoxy-1,4-benzoquinol methylase